MNYSLIVSLLSLFINHCHSRFLLEIQLHNVSALEIAVIVISFILVIIATIILCRNRCRGENIAFHQLNEVDLKQTQQSSGTQVARKSISELSGSQCINTSSSSQDDGSGSKRKRKRKKDRLNSKNNQVIGDQELNANQDMSIE